MYYVWRHAIKISETNFAKLIFGARILSFRSAGGGRGKQKCLGSSVVVCVQQT